MCTVTLFPVNSSDFILTSNRDETPKRKTIPPKLYTENKTNMLFPKDELAGGTWIGLSEKKRLICLLNGGYEKHVRKDSYRLSRGVVVKELLASEDAVSMIENYVFDDIEPFTIVLVDWNSNLQYYELVWTGQTKHFQQLSNTKPHIWSSATLYDDEMKQLRKSWFKNWLNDTNDFSQESILQFHKNDKLGSSDVSLKMKRLQVETVSVTSVKKNNNTISVLYHDFLSGKVHDYKNVTFNTMQTL